MFRICLTLAFLAATFFPSGKAASNFANGPADFGAPNSTIQAHRCFDAETLENQFFAFDFSRFSIPVDSASAVKVLMLNTFSYDSVYPKKVEQFIREYLPKTNFKKFTKGQAQDLQNALADRHVVVLSYPSNADPKTLLQFAPVLKNFVKNGGTVILTGTHEFEIPNQLGLLELDYGYYFQDPVFKRNPLSHPITKGLPANFSSRNYAYPFDVSDPAFVSLIDVNGYGSIGYKNEGKGAVVYLGLEFYYDEDVASRLLVNSVLWGGQLSAAAKNEKTATTKGATYRPRRATLRLEPHEVPAKDSVNLKVYPNPYVETADLEIAIGQATTLSVEISDQTGQKIYHIFQKKTLGTGKHLIELPNFPPGVYFVKCKTGNTTVVRKVVKMERY